MKKVLLFLLPILFLASNCFAFTYSLVDDWSNAINPNGPWAYNEGNNPLQYNVAGWPLGEFGLLQTAWTVLNGDDTYIVPLLSHSN